VRLQYLLEVGSIELCRTHKGLEGGRIGVELFEPRGLADDIDVFLGSPPRLDVDGSQKTRSKRAQLGAIVVVQVIIRCVVNLAEESERGLRKQQLRCRLLHRVVPPEKLRENPHLARHRSHNPLVYVRVQNRRIGSHRGRL
jgi:hypothetical protein